MIIEGIEIEPIVADALGRAGYGPTVAPVVTSRMALLLLTTPSLTPQYVANLADELIPGIIEALAAEAAELMPSVALH